MNDPDLTKARPGLQSLKVTPGAARAIGYIRVGGGIMMVYGAIKTGGRLREAWGTDEFALVAAQEGLTWTGAIAGSAMGAQLGGLLCAPAGPVTVACVAAGFLGGLILGAVGGAIGSLIIPLTIRFAAALTETLVAIVEGVAAAGRTIRAASDAMTRDFLFRPMMTNRHSINPCNWELVGLAGTPKTDVQVLGLYIWSKLGTISPTNFLGQFKQPLKSYSGVPPQLLASIAAGISTAVQKKGDKTAVFKPEALGELPPHEFVGLLKRYGLLRHRYEPALLADIQLTP